MANKIEQAFLFETFDTDISKPLLAGIVGGGRGLTAKNSHFIKAAAFIRLFALSFPEAAPSYDFIERYLLRAADRTQEGDTKTVLRAVKQLGTATVKDIASLTSLPPNTVQSHLTKLCKLRRVVKTRMPPETGRGGNKRGFLYAVPDHS